MAPDTAARRNGGYESGDGPLPDPELLPTGPAPGAQKATTTAAGIPYEGTDCTAEEAVEAVSAVRATAALRCPVHGIPDCSALLNGCVLPRELGYCPRADVDAAVEGVADTYDAEGVAIWWAGWVKQGPVERARRLLAATTYGGQIAT